MKSTSWVAVALVLVAFLVAFMENGKSSGYLDQYVDSTWVSQRTGFNFIAGSGTSLAASDDVANQRVNFTITNTTAATGSPITLDLGDDGGDDSTDLTEIAVTGDTNSIFTEPSADKLLIALANNWPSADTATALAANGANCGAGNYPLGVDASGAVEDCTAAGGGEDLQQTYDNESAPSLITLTDALGGIIFEGDSEVADPSLTIRDSTAGKTGLEIDNDDEAANENSPIFRLANSTSAGGDTQFDFVVTTADALEIRGDDGAADLTISSAGAITGINVSSGSDPGHTHTGAGIEADALDFDDFVDAMTLDASTTIAFGSNDLIFNVANPGSNAFDVNGTGNFTGDLVHFHQHTGNPGGGNILHVESEDPDINPIFHVSSADADLGSELVAVLIDAVDDDDTDWIPLRIQDDRDGSPDTILEVSSTGAITAINVTSGADPGHTHTGAALSGIDISDDTNLTAGDHLTLTDDDLDVDDDFLLNDGDIGTGTFDFGGADDLEIPNGAAPTVDTLGQIALDTTSDQIVYYGAATSTPMVLSPVRGGGAIWESPVDADNFIFPKLPFGFTVTAIDCIIDPADSAESVVLTIQERDSTGDNPSTVEAAITCDNDGAADNGTIDAPTIESGNYLGFDIGAVTGTVTQISFGVWGYIIRE